MLEVFIFPVQAKSAMTYDPSLITAPRHETSFLSTWPEMTTSQGNENVVLDEKYFPALEL